MNARGGYILLLLQMVAALAAAEPQRDHWSLKPLAHANPPALESATWCRTPVDAFIFKKLQEQSMEPSTAADKRTRIRRAYFDLIGLPPTPAQVNAFLTDSSPNAFERIVDDLLERPEYGERWARHW